MYLRYSAAVTDFFRRACGDGFALAFGASSFSTRGSDSCMFSSESTCSAISSVFSVASCLLIFGTVIRDFRGGRAVKNGRAIELGKRRESSRTLPHLPGIYSAAPFTVAMMFDTNSFGLCVVFPTLTLLNEMNYRKTRNLLPATTWERERISRVDSPCDIFCHFVLLEQTNRYRLPARVTGISPLELYFFMAKNVLPTICGSMCTILWSAMNSS